MHAQYFIINLHRSCCFCIQSYAEANELMQLYYSLIFILKAKDSSLYILL